LDRRALRLRPRRPEVRSSGPAMGEKLKHPFKHPYGIASCFPQRLNRAQSTQIGSHDTEIPRIRYAVPSLIYTANSCSNRADLGFVDELEHPYQHPYALASIGPGPRRCGTRGARCGVGQPLVSRCRVVRSIRFLAQTTRSHSQCDRDGSRSSRLCWPPSPWCAVGRAAAARVPVALFAAA